MKTSTIVWVLIALIVIGGSWYWYSGMQSGAADQATGPSTAMGINGSSNQDNLGQPDNGSVQQPGDGTSVSQNLALGTDSNAKLGTYLIAYNGMTVYTYAKDKLGVSNCTGTCADAWPPYTVPAATTLNAQVGVGGHIDTIQRADGTFQVTYNGMPLYFWKNDTKSGDTNGQGIGGVWYVVKP
jgi:predicted lipoprotein with Yx(FWY)xxD motif